MKWMSATSPSLCGVAHSAAIRIRWIAISSPFAEVFGGLNER